MLVFDHYQYTYGVQQSSAQAVVSLLEIIGAVTQKCTLQYDHQSQVNLEQQAESARNTSVAYTSIKDLRLHINLALMASREHLWGCAYLLPLQPVRPLQGPIQALARSASEAAALNMWLCDHRVDWIERLRRFNQFYVKISHGDVRAGDTGVDETQIECDAAIQDAINYGWIDSRQSATIKRWAAEVPRYSQLIQHTYLGQIVDPAVWQQRYRMDSRATHNHPIVSWGTANSKHTATRMHHMLTSTFSALVVYAAACKQFTSWHGVLWSDEDIACEFEKLNSAMDLDNLFEITTDG